MKLVKLIEFFRNRLKTVVRICYAVLGLLILVDAFLVNKGHSHPSEQLPAFGSVFDALRHPFSLLDWGAEHLPAFWSVFGFVACALIIVLSKWYGHAGIMTREDYYDE